MRDSLINARSRDREATRSSASSAWEVREYSSPPLSPMVRPVPYGADESPSLHLYQVHIDFAEIGMTRDALMKALLAQGVGTQVHYIPLHQQPYFKARYGPMRLPGAEAFYGAVLALPLFPAMSDHDAGRAVAALQGLLAY